MPEELSRYTPTPAVSRKVSKGGLSWTDDSVTGSISDSSDVASQGAAEIDDFSEDDDVPAYYFPDGTPVPAHLLCPEKWIGVYLTEITGSEAHEIDAHTRMVGREIVDNYNPKRPLSEVWPSFIEDTKDLLSQSEAVLEEMESPLAGMRIDWAYEQAYRFPEIQAIRLDNDSNNQLMLMFMVDMGVLPPDWNLIQLPDGRDFRVEHGYRYVFSQTRETESGTNTGTFEICKSDPATAETIYIVLNETSDAELERIGGWSYNHNPYTGAANEP